jgi:hypothetical protein
MARRGSHHTIRVAVTRKASSLMSLYHLVPGTRKCVHLLPTYEDTLASMIG